MDMQALEAREAEYQQETYRFLLDVRNDFALDPDLSETIDVRIQVLPDGTRYFWYGDASFDTDHRGFWGAGTVSADDDDVQLIDTARDLVEQAIDHAAQCA